MLSIKPHSTPQRQFLQLALFGTSYHISGRIITTSVETLEQSGMVIVPAAFKNIVVLKHPNAKPGRVEIWARRSKPPRSRSYAMQRGRWYYEFVRDIDLPKQRKEKKKEPKKEKEKYTYIYIYIYIYISIYFLTTRV